MTHSEELLIDERTKVINQLTIWNLHHADSEFIINTIDLGNDHGLFIYSKKHDFLMPYDIQQMQGVIEKSSYLLNSSVSIQVWTCQGVPNHPLGSITIKPCIKVNLWINYVRYKERYGTDI